VPPWPTLGVALEMSKGGIYEAVRRGDFETIRVGRLIKVITAPLRKKLGI
jgi:hypothetical protein